MIYIVIKAGKSKDTADQQAILETETSVERMRAVRAYCVTWECEDTSATVGDLVATLHDVKIKNNDYILLVKPGTIVNAVLINAVSEARRTHDKIINIKCGRNESWNGVMPFFVRFSVLKQLIFEFETFDQDSQSRYFAEALRVASTYSTVEADTVTLPDTERIDLLSKDSADTYNKEWYFEFQLKWLKTLKSFDTAVPEIIQLAYIYMLQYRIICNANGGNRYVLNSKDLEIFFKETKNNLMFIDDCLLVDKEKSYIEYLKLNIDTKLYLLQLKYPKDEIRYKYVPENIYRYFKGIKLDNAIRKGIIVESMDYYDDTLTIVGYSRFIYDPAKSYLVCRCGDIEYQLYDTHRYNGYSIFGRKIQESRTFRVDIPRNVLDNSTGITFHLRSNNGNTDIKMSLYFTKHMSKLNERTRSYWYIKSLNKTIKYYNREIHIEESSFARRFYNELRYLQDMILSKDRRGRASLLRIVYFITKPFFRKPIWIFYDKLYKAGDNGEYLYNYALSQDDGVRKVYVMSKSSTDVERFRKEKKPFVLYASLLNKLLFLNADIVFATHSGQPTFSGLKFEGAYTKDLFNYNVLFIQHGLTIQDQANFLNRFIDNTKLYFIASHFEAKNLLRSSYGYDKNQIMTTGVARYDGLVSKPKKQILIAPSWRSYLASPGGGKGDARQKNDRFKDSDYFKLYNNLINDSKLLDTAEELGYKIVYLLHPVTSSQIDDFDGHDRRASVIASTSDVSYEKMLTESDLMVTDYSGVQFDFAYMKKPILYYHPKELPPTYEEAIYRYETDALGEIVDTHDKIVEKLCWYMENNCKVPSEYEARMDNFFYHHDHNSAKRIYDEAIRFSRGERRGGHTKELIDTYKKIVKKSQYIRHALGGADGHMYMNSVKVMADWYKNGDRLFEADIAETADGQLVLFHPAAKSEPEASKMRLDGLVFNNNELSYNQFVKHVMFNKYPTSTFKDLVNFMRDHSDAYVMIDAGKKTYTATRSLYEKIVHEAGDESILQRLIVGGHTTRMMRAVADVYKFSLYNFYYEPDDKRERLFERTEDFIAYCETNGFTSASIRRDKFTDEVAEKFKHSSLVTYVFTTDDEIEAERCLTNGADIIGSNFLE